MLVFAILLVVFMGVLHLNISVRTCVARIVPIELIGWLGEGCGLPYVAIHYVAIHITHPPFIYGHGAGSVLPQNFRAVCQLK